MAEERNNDRSSHQTENQACGLSENMFVSPKILVNHIYSDTESEPESEECDDQNQGARDYPVKEKEAVTKIHTFLTTVQKMKALQQKN